MRKLRVLIADDHEQMLTLLTRLLVAEFEVVAAVSDGAKLIESAIVLDPDVIVSDINMPLLTGPEAMRALISAGHDIPFVLVSASGCGAQECINQGATAFVDKADLLFELPNAVRFAAFGRVYISRGTSLPVSDSISQTNEESGRYRN